MNVTVAIFTYNRCDNLRQTLAALSRVYVPSNIRCELIVVDNASTDQTAELVQSYAMPGMTIRYAYEGQRGQVYARNTAIGLARGEILLFTDDDVRPEPDWIEKMCAPIILGKAQAVAGRVKIAPHLERSWMGPLHRAWLASTDGLSMSSPEHIVGANMAFSREVLLKVSGFDTELGPGLLGFYDDTLFSWQLREAGYQIAAAFDAVVEHHFDESRLLRSSFTKHAENQGRSYAYVAYHWEHVTIHQPRVQLAKSLFRLAKMRIEKKRECLQSEGLPEWEMQLITSVYFHKQFLIEQKRARNYEKRGLVKAS